MLLELFLKLPIFTSSRQAEFFLLSYYDDVKLSLREMVANTWKHFEDLVLSTIPHEQSALNQIDWVSRLKGTEPDRSQAIAELRTILIKGLNKVLTPRGADSNTIEDIVQESVVRILDKIDQFEGRSQFVTWAMSIAINHGISMLRRKHFRNVSLDDVASDSEMKWEVEDPHTQDPEDISEKNVLLSKLQNLIQENLTEKQRTLIMSHLKGVPMDVLVERIGTNKNAIYKLFFDAKTKLKAGLETAGYNVGDIQRLFP